MTKSKTHKAEALTPTIQLCEIHIVQHLIKTITYIRNEGGKRQLMQRCRHIYHRDYGISREII